LLIDVVVENRERMDEDDWKGVLNAIACVRTNLSKNTPTKILAADPIDAFPKFPLVRGESLSNLDRSPFKKKVVGSRIGYVGDFTSSVVITSGSFECGGFYRSVVLANGGILMDHAPGGALVFGNEDITCENIASSLVIAKGRVKVKRRIALSLVFSDDDIECDDLIFSTVIAKGSVHTKKDTKNIILEKSAKSAAVSYFSLKSVGLTLAADGKAFRVEKVAAGSRASKCGFRAGDLLTIDASSGLAGLDTIVRRSVAKETEPALPVRRNGEPTFVILRLWD
jgi:hypothetical protein